MIGRLLEGISTEKFRSILCLDGDLRNLANVYDMFRLPLIAADGAANQIIDAGLAPDLIIGDLDSVDPDLLLRFDHLKLADQNTSDFQKALVYMKENELLPCIILGMSGGNIDHILNNFNIFLEEDGNVFFDGNIVGFNCVGPKKTHLKLPVDTKLSILGIPGCNLTTHGLKWELEPSDLAFATYPPNSRIFGYNSCFNRTVMEDITIEVKSGTALLLIYLSTVMDAGSGLDHAEK
jgi:thiamine pyrophosphokinase